MSQYVVDTSITNGYLELKNIPFENNMQVRVIVVPKIELSRMSFLRILDNSEQTSKSISSEVSRERDER